MALTRPRVSSGGGSAAAAARGEAGRRSGLGEGEAITVKGERADAEQRAVIDGCLSEAQELGAAKRVLVAVVMAITQESTARSLNRGDRAGPDSRGPFQQRSAWGPEATRLDPAGSTRLFLTVNKGYGVQGWKVVHGSLSNAPGDLSRAINAVQHSAFPDAYAQWQAEAESTVAAWLGSDAGFGAVDRRYEFVRGERGGQKESSWDASGRLAEEVGWHRWAAGNVLYFVSDQELRQAAPSLTIRGDEGWLLSEPAWDWGSGRAVQELTLRVLAEHWGVMPGGVVLMATGGPTDGRWLVTGVAGQRLESPEAEITMRRPTLRRPEPPAEVVDGGELGGFSGEGGGILDACRSVSQEARGYLYGGGHGASLGSVDPDADLDCSSSVSLALYRAGYFDGDKAITSGAFASSWGQAGEGRRFTVWASPSHVFIQLLGSPDGWWRFDTSPHGDGERGPRLRRTSRETAGFTPRHWPQQ